MLLKAKNLRNVELGKELKAFLVAAPPKDWQQIAQGKMTGGWLTAEPSSLNGTKLTVYKFRDSLRI